MNLLTHFIVPFSVQVAVSLIQCRITKRLFLPSPPRPPPPSSSSSSSLTLIYSGMILMFASLFAITFLMKIVHIVGGMHSVTFELVVAFHKHYSSKWGPHLTDL